VAIDFEAEGLLKGTRGKAREARRMLLEELAADGVPLEELRRAVEEERLALLPVERLLEGEGERYTAAEVAERAGVEIDLLPWLRQALGLPMPDPEERAFTDDDVEAARRAKLQLDAGLPAEGMRETSRVLGMALSQVAAASRGLVGEAILRPGDTELKAAHRYSEAARLLLPMIGPMLDYVFELHLREQLRNDVIGAAELRSGRLAGGQEVSACFADMVEFTRLGERLEPEELGAITGRLNELAGDVAAPPVRLVKMIGDAAMMVSTDNDALLEAALALVERAQAEEGLPLLRAGAARGPALARGGDYYGRPVNLASRITALAYPGSVLASEEVHDEAGERFHWSFAGARKVRGVKGQVKLFRCRRRRSG
jgi:adenylate cyclase